ncbi:MAG: ATPase, T2SS/T4P/T4SS family [Candidatus Diapherotrites archaeon]|nr:ATPase, T2SS/T4P/T4SS family [Candidatus Diapherotrites archaeon]
MKEKIVESYSIQLGKSPIEINIVRKPELYVLEYNAGLPEFGIGTQALLKKLKHELIAGIGIALEKIADPRFLEETKSKLIERAEKMISKEFPGMNVSEKSMILSFLVNEMMGLGSIEILLNDANLEEIVINHSHEPIWVYHKKHGWLKTNILIQPEEEIENYANIIARRIGKQITVLSPLLDAHLLSGDRANATLFPISGKGNTITIRRFRRDPWTVLDLIQNGTLTPDVVALLWEAFEYELNVLFSGGTASGKTTILGACLPFIQPNHRVLSIEDTRELILPDFMHWVPMTTREPNSEGKGAVEMIDLLVNSLRMRPDRIIVGEVRRKREAEVMFEAMHTGHAVYTTVHANTADETITRLTNPPIGVPISLLEAVNLNVVMFRNRRLGARRVLQVAEFIPEKRAATEQGLKTNTLFRWKPVKDEVDKNNESIRFYDELGLHTGLTKAEIDQEMNEKQKVLNWMIQQKVTGVNQVGRIIASYYSDKSQIVEMASQNKKFEFEDKASV